MRLIRARALRPADPNGLSDPFVTVEWDGCQLSTRVIPFTLNPTWEETLYFPIKLVRLEKKALESKPNISIRVFDMDEAGHDLLGSCEVRLPEIARDHCNLYLYL